MSERCALYPCKNEVAGIRLICDEHVRERQAACYFRLPASPEQPRANPKCAYCPRETCDHCHFLRQYGACSVTRYWHDPESPQLDEHERRAMYLRQCEIGATKQCAECRQVKPVVEFPTYGVRRCWECRSNGDDYPSTSNQFVFWSKRAMV